MAQRKEAVLLQHDLAQPLLLAERIATVHATLHLAFAIQSHAAAIELRMCNQLRGDSALQSVAARIGYKALLMWDLIDPSPLGYYRRLSRPVDGWLTRKEECALFRIARAVPRDECIVELGSWFGRSAILLGGGSVHGQGAPVYAVDLFSAAGFAKEVLEQRAGDAARDFLDRFQTNMCAAGLKDKVTAVRSATAELGETWAGPPVGFLFIDADHSYDGVRRDWTSWKHRLVPGAKVAFHDYQNPSFEGVTRFADELIAAGKLQSVKRHDSIVCGEVTHEHSAR